MKKVLRNILPMAALLLGACQFITPTAVRLDADAGSDEVVAVDTPVTLNGSATGGLAPYTFRWSIESQPDGGGVDISDVGTNGKIDIDSIGLEGRYVFRLRVTDATGETDASFVTITVGGDLPITASSAKAVAVVNDTAQLGVTIDGDTTAIENLTYVWEVLAGQATLDNPAVSDPVLTVLAEETIEVSVKVSGEVAGSPRFGSESVFVVGVNDVTPQVVIEVGGAVTGEIVFELLTEPAPKTCANFLRYVDDDFFDGVVWHRVMPGFVIQGGAFERQGDSLVMREEGKRPPVESEANNGESNLRGTVAMALRGDDANSGDDQFFVNLGDNASLDAGSPPFTVFARVISGMDVVDEIAAVETGTDPSGMSDAPTEDVVMVTVRRAETEVNPDDAGTNGIDTTGLAEVFASVSAPLGLVGDVVEASATVDQTAPDLPQSVVYRWQVIQGMATLGSEDEANTTVTIDAAETIKLKVTVRDEANPDVIVGTSGVAVVGISDVTPEVVIENDGQVTGTIVLELLTEEAPIACANFLQYVDSRFYDDNIWHRVVAGVAIQAGGITREGVPVEVAGARDPIPDEAPNGLTNQRGMVAMALSSRQLGTAVSQFFINLADNPEFDTDPPFTVFARVIEGLDVVDAIGAVEVGLAVGGFDNFPKKDIDIVTVRRRN